MPVSTPKPLAIASHTPLIATTDAGSPGASTNCGCRNTAIPPASRAEHMIASVAGTLRIDIPTSSRSGSRFQALMWKSASMCASSAETIASGSPLRCEDPRATNTSSATSPAGTVVQAW